ncbi:unnamed protein product [Symbiodinium sp. CCMP2456]|nr:unnamed protein product [Symbiodinium sp. CCMP2456]
MDNPRVFISSLPWAVSKATILQLLSEQRLVSHHIQVVRKGSFLQNGNFCSAFVTFENADMAVRAIGLLDGKVDPRLGPVALKAEMARPKPRSRRSRSRTAVRDHENSSPHEPTTPADDSDDDTEPTTPADESGGVDEEASTSPADDVIRQFLLGAAQHRSDSEND